MNQQNMNNNFRGNENRNSYQQNSAATTSVEPVAKVGPIQTVTNIAKKTQSTKAGRIVGGTLAVYGAVELGTRLVKGVIWLAKGGYKEIGAKVQTMWPFKKKAAAEPAPETTEEK